MGDEYIDRSNIRVEEQHNVMNQIADDSVCPFCSEHLSRYHKKPILREGDFWVFTENQWPYENTQFHFLIIHKKHAETISDISSDAWNELLELFQWAEREYNFSGGGIGMRFGHTDFSAATVKHIHVQLIIPVEPKKRTNDIVFCIGKKPKT